MTPSRINVASGLSDQQRIKRICELLCEAMLRTEASRALALPVPLANQKPRGSGSPVLPLSSPSESDETKILHYLALVGAAPPARIRATLGLSRWCFHGALHRLLANGRIVTVGRSRALTYRLSDSQLATARVGSN